VSERKKLSSEEVVREWRRPWRAAGRAAQGADKAGPGQHAVVPTSWPLCMGFFTDTYDLFRISLVSKLLVARLYYTGRDSLLPKVSVAVKNALWHAGSATKARPQERLRLHADPHMVVCSIASGALVRAHGEGRHFDALLLPVLFWPGFGIGDHHV
jgi:hypothetical protein